MAKSSGGGGRGKGGGGAGVFTSASSGAAQASELAAASRLFPQAFDDLDREDLPGQASFVGMTVSQYERFTDRIAKERAAADRANIEATNKALARIEKAGGVNNLPASVRQSAIEFLRGASGRGISNPREGARQKAKEWGIL